MTTSNGSNSPVMDSRSPSQDTLIDRVSTFLTVSRSRCRGGEVKRAIAKAKESPARNLLQTHSNNNKIDGLGSGFTKVLGAETR